ncbi:MAG: aspartate--tRNA ligase, partial [Bacteroidota bacterium]|nr:aspartate--tRNA ligase [Bacteroidota bacterium]
MVRKYLISNGFTEIETPFLIKSTPEGARDFIVPSRMNQGKFYALPQSPQTFKQLLMISGMEKYFQIVKCFRDEDLRSDRQPEFTQIDCEMSFVNQKDVMECFEGLLSDLLLEIHGIEKKSFPVISYFDAMNKYGSDKPDIRFGMEIHNIKEYTKNKGFKIFNDSEVVVAITVPKASIWSRKEIDYWIEWVKKPQVGSKGLVWVKNNLDGSVKSSVDKFYDYKNLKKWINECECKKGDLIFVMSGKKNETLIQMGKLRMEIAEKLNLRKAFEFAPLWVVDFPLFFKDDMNNYHPMHHPFTSPKSEHLDLLDEKPNEVYALAYDLVMNGNEIGGGSIRIINTKIQEKIFSVIGLNKKKSKEQFGFLVDALEFGAPPHGGIALGFDRLVAILNGDESIRDYIAFPKNNSGYDVMIKAPSEVDPQQLDDLGILKK